MKGVYITGVGILVGDEGVQGVIIGLLVCYGTYFYHTTICIAVTDNVIYFYMIVLPPWTAMI